MRRTPEDEQDRIANQSTKEWQDEYGAAYDRLYPSRGNDRIAQAINRAEKAGVRFELIDGELKVDNLVLSARQLSWVLGNKQEITAVLRRRNR